MKIKKIITNFKNKTSYGHENISNKYLKLFKCEITEPLAVTYNKSIDQGVIPDKLKIGHIIPVYKSKSKKELNNYRPITLLSHISKIYEKLLQSRMMDFINKVKSS